jgi:hypothetical protein
MNRRREDKHTTGERSCIRHLPARHRRCVTCFLLRRRPLPSRPVSYGDVPLRGISAHPRGQVAGEEILEHEHHCSRDAHEWHRRPPHQLVGKTQAFGPSHHKRHVKKIEAAPP